MQGQKAAIAGGFVHFRETCDNRSRAMPKRPETPTKTIVSLYKDEKHSLRQIARRIGMTHQGVRWRLAAAEQGKGV